MDTIDLDDDDYFEDIDLDADNSFDEKKKNEEEKKEEEEEEHNRWQIIHEKLVNNEVEVPSTTNTTNLNNQINNDNTLSFITTRTTSLGLNEKENKKTEKKPVSVNTTNMPISSSMKSATSISTPLTSSLTENNNNLYENDDIITFTSLIERMEHNMVIRNKPSTASDGKSPSSPSTPSTNSNYSFTSLSGRLQLEILSYCSEADLFKVLQTNFQISRAAAIILWGSQLHFGAFEKERLKLFVGALNRKPQIHPYALYVQSVTIENIINEIPMYTRNPCWILVRELLYHCSKNIRRLKLSFQDEKFMEIKSLEIPEIYFSCLEELDIEPYSDVSPEFVTDLLKRCEANGRLRKLSLPNCFWAFIPFSITAEIARLGSALVYLDLSAYKQTEKQTKKEDLPLLATEAQIKEFNDIMAMVTDSCHNLQYLNLSHNMYIYDTTIEQFLVNNQNLERIYIEDTHNSDYMLLALSHAAPPTLSYIEMKCSYVDNFDKETVQPPTTKFTTSLVEMLLKELNNRKSVCEIIAISLPDRLIQPGSTSFISTKVWLNTLEGCTLDETLNDENDKSWRKWRKYGKLRIWV